MRHPGMVWFNPPQPVHPLISVLIAVYNGWALLDRCLKSLAEQINPPAFEVVVVDDGSQTPAPAYVYRWEQAFRLKIVRQSHQGIPVARNRAIQSSNGPLLLFVDADCKLRSNCLTALADSVARHPQHNCFQLHLTGDCSSLVGRAEELRLSILQQHLLQADGSIRYLNTAGCAMWRDGVDAQSTVFHPAALRSEDTLFLANLMQKGELPVFVPNAVVQHAIPLSPMRLFLKVVHSAYLAQTANQLIASKGVRLWVTPRERFAMFLSMWKSSRVSSIGSLACLVLLVRQGLGRCFSTLYGCLAIKPRLPGLAAREQRLPLPSRITN